MFHTIFITTHPPPSLQRMFLPPGSNILDKMEASGTAYDLPPFTLDYGLYNLQYVMTVTLSSGVKRHNAATCYFKVKPLPLVALIAGGSVRTIGTGDEIKVVWQSNNL